MNDRHMGTYRSRKPSPPSALSEAARRERERFFAAYHQNYDEKVSGVALSILVWGPSLKRRTAVARKRREIRDKLIELGHNAMFSEEIPDSSSNPTSGETEMLSLKELCQIEEAHYVIVLVDKHSPGVQAELTLLCTRPDIAAKIFALSPLGFKQGFVHSAIELMEGGNGAIYWYADEEIASCHVLTEAVARVEKVRALHAFNRAKVAV